MDYYDMLDACYEPDLFDGEYYDPKIHDSNSPCKGCSGEDCVCCEVYAESRLDYYGF
jgi:hypothetical protein